MWDYLDFGNDCSSEFPEDLPADDCVDEEAPEPNDLPLEEEASYDEEAPESNDLPLEEETADEIPAEEIPEDTDSPAYENLEEDTEPPDEEFSSPEGYEVLDEDTGDLSPDEDDENTSDDANSSDAPADFSGGLTETADTGDTGESELSGQNPDAPLPGETRENDSPAQDTFDACEPEESLESRPEDDAPEDRDTDSDANPRSLSSDFDNPDLFDEYAPGDYTYTRNPYGMQASGQLHLAESTSRNPEAQLEAGGDDRRDDDEGGHLIGARFGGSGEIENLTAQNQNLNRGGFKTLENEWARQLSAGNKVFVNIEAYQRDGCDRPEAYMGYYITESPDGNRTLETFHLLNESRNTINEIEAEAEALEDKLHS